MNNKIQEIKDSMKNLAFDGKWCAWNYPSAGWQVGTQRGLEHKTHGGVGSTYHEEFYGQGDVFYASWWQFPSDIMNKDIEEANARFIANAPEYIRYLLRIIEELAYEERNNL